MNVLVHKARHPQLREYIHDTLAGLIPFIHKVYIFPLTIVMYLS